MNRKLIDTYEAGGSKLRAGIQGLSPAQLDARPADGSWTIRQIVLHLMDSDLIASERMKRVIAMDVPALIAYDESAFAAKLSYDVLDANIAVDVFDGNRKLTAALLRRQPDAAFDRVGNHNERGPITLASLVETYVQHLDHHMAFIQRKRNLAAPAAR